MAAKFSRHIALTRPLATFVENEVASGHYASASEMVRNALRLLKEKEAAKAARSSKAAKPPKPGETS